MIDAATLDGIHSHVQEAGWRLLQPYRFGDTDVEHVRTLLEFANFTYGAHVLDIGCGIGECAKIMHDIRADLDFTCLNFSERQLRDCPAQFKPHLADAHSLPFDDDSFDAVMFNASLGNMDCERALAEASRVLKQDGVLFLNEPRRVSGDNDAMRSILQFEAHSNERITYAATRLNLTSDSKGTIPTATEYLKAEWDDVAKYAEAFDGVIPWMWRFTKNNDPIASAFSRHSKVALQLSGGKDSLATLHLLKPYWDRLTVYWLNSGDAIPATIEFMNRIAELVPKFKVIDGKQVDTINKFGWPSDVVPQSHSILGDQILGTTPFKVQERLHCCIESIMRPMHDQMVADGITLVVRGKRDDDADRTGVRSGDICTDYEVLFPIINWTERDVYTYLATNNITLPEYYNSVNDSLDCKTCTAWSNHRADRYLRKALPDAYAEKHRRLGLILGAVRHDLAHMLNEVNYG